MFDRYIVYGGVRYESMEVPWDVDGSPEDTRGSKKRHTCDRRRVGPKIRKFFVKIEK